jgi:hypothetical protein
MTTKTTIGEMLGASMSAKDVRTHGSDTQHVPHTGGPAFPAQPTQRIAPGVTVESNNGMNLRDWFAGKALSGMLADPNVKIGDASDDDHLSTLAYRLADAMIRARGAA